MCPRCGYEMDYAGDGLHVCSECGHEVTEEDIESGYYEYSFGEIFGEENEMPSGCVECGNPDYPKCWDACNRD